MKKNLIQLFAADCKQQLKLHLQVEPSKSNRIPRSRQSFDLGVKKEFYRPVVIATMTKSYVSGEQFALNRSFKSQLNEAQQVGFIRLLLNQPWGSKMRDSIMCACKQAGYDCQEIVLNQPAEFELNRDLHFCKS